MTCSKPLYILFAISLFLIASSPVLAQAPNISYTTPQTYTVNQAIVPLAPTNTGGAVPANTYGLVTTFAGNEKLAHVDGQGLAASFFGAGTAATDKFGNVYIGDGFIRKITPTGFVSTIVGIGGGSVINGPVSVARFNSPCGMTFTSDGTCYVVDGNNEVIRKITPEGIVSTYAGNGVLATIDGPASKASFNSPMGITIDPSGNLYVVEQMGAIRKISATGVVSTLAGQQGEGYQDGSGTTAIFNGPMFIVIDKSGNLFVTDRLNNMIRKITPAGVVSTFAGHLHPGANDGVGTAAGFGNPGGIAIDNLGNMYVVDISTCVIRKITPSGIVTTIAGMVEKRGLVNGIGSAARFNSPVDVALDADDNLFVADGNNNVVRKITLTGYIIDKPLPPGLTFDPTTGTISGTPTAPSPATDYTITAYNTSGSSSTVLNISVDNSTPVINAPNISYQTPQIYTVNTTITPLSPTNTGGVVPATVYGKLTIFAGNHGSGLVNGPAVSASFNSPPGIAFDAAGNAYIADDGNSVIREINTAKIVTTFAGNGSQGHTNGPANLASFVNPTGVCVDNAGNVYVADQKNNLIRKVTSSGVVTTFAGSGSIGSADGEGALASFNQPYGIAISKSGNIYVADTGNGLIREITPAGAVTTITGAASPGFVNGPAASASFRYPEAIAIDNLDNIYVADNGNFAVRKITPTGLVTTLAGNGTYGTANGSGTSASFENLVGIAVDYVGNIYVADATEKQVRKITPVGLVTTFVSSSFSPGAVFFSPWGLSFDAEGNLYVTDAQDDQILKTITTGYTIDKALPTGLTFDSTTGTISGTPTATSPATDYTITAYNAGGSSSTVVNISVDASTPVINAPNISYQTPQTYTVNATITPLAPSNTGGAVPAHAYGQVTTFAGSGAVGAVNGPAKTASFNSPAYTTVDGSGNVYVSDQENYLIRKISPSGVVSTLAGTGSFGNTNGVGTAASFNATEGMTSDGQGNLYVADALNNSIRKIAISSGTVSTFAGTGVSGSTNGTVNTASFGLPYGITFDGSGNIYITDGYFNQVRKIAANGVVTTLAGSGNKGNANGVGAAASFYWPSDIAADRSGNLYVADSENNLIRKITPNGTVSTFAGSGLAGSADGNGTSAMFYDPTGVAIDAIGNLYVADDANNVLRAISPSGNVTTIAGSTRGNVDGIGANARFNGPAGVSYDGVGNLFVADQSNNTIREIAITGYKIDKPLPAGLTFDPTTGIISGTPTAPSPATNYTVTAYNLGGSSSTVVNITVNNTSAVLPAPPNISYVTPKTYYLNTTIPTLSPTNTGGAVPANTYSLVKTIAGNGAQGNANGQGAAATFAGPTGIVFDNVGNIYVSELINNDIRKITPAGLVSTFAGTGKTGATNGAGLQATFNSPGQLAADAAGNIYVADGGNQLIRKISPSDLVSTFAGTGGAGAVNGAALSATFNDPTGLTFDQTGNMYVADRNDNTLRKIDQTGQVTTLIALNAGAAPPTSNIGFYQLATDVSGKLYFGYTNQVGSVASAGRLNILAGTATPGFANGNGALASFNGVVGVAVDKLGNIYSGDQDNNRIRLTDPTGKTTTLAGFLPGFNDGINITASLYQPNGLTIDPTGNYLYVADFGNNMVRRIGLTGYYIDKSLPTGLVFDPTTGIISGTPVIPSPPVNYTITAYNTGGSSTTVVNIQILDEETVTFGPLPAKTVCDADFDPGATSANAITYTSGNEAVATIVAGKIHITGAGTSVITASDGTSDVPQTLTVTAAVTPTISISPSAPDDCQGNAVSFTASIVGGGTNPGYQWQVNGQDAGTNSPQFASSILTNGDNITCILTSNAACTTAATVTSNSATFTLDPEVSTSVKIVSSETGPVCKGTAVTFTAVAFSPDVNPTYQWQVNGANAGTDQSTFTTSNLADGDVVTCILTSTGKCLVDAETTSNSIAISLDPQSECVVSIPNTFTPNGDGVNDLWDITALQAYPGCTVSIFSRDGSQVYYSINYPKAWDGTYNGKKLPVGTYYYVIDLKNGKKPLSGPITLLR